MRRREFLGVLGGAAAALPSAARAQERVRARRIGVLMTTAANDPESPSRVAVFALGLQQLGWTIGDNVRVEYRWSPGDPELTRKYAAELIAWAPDVIVVSGGAGAGTLLQATRTIPIVFAIVPDPVGAGFVDSLARPGGNATGFLMFEYGIAGKWLELLKELAPRVKRAAVLRDPANTAGIGQFSAVQSVAPSLGIEVSPINMREASAIERDIAGFARTPDGGLILTASALAPLHRNLVMEQAAQHRLPAIYPTRFYAAGGGLVAYGPDFTDQFRHAGNYAGRILKGEKPGDLPVQAPTKYELVVNLKTARALGLTVPQSVIARADEVIE